MANREQPYDPYIPNGSNGPYVPSGTGINTEEIQKEIDKTTAEMTRNMARIGERGERLDTLQNKSDNLAEHAQGFRRGANRVRKQMWWKDMKMRMCLIVGIIILLIVIIVPSVIATKH